MTLPLQQAWLRRLVARASRAARLTFDADEARRQEAKVHVELHQKVVTWQVLHTLIDEVDQREKSVINRLVRQYGNLVFDTFHKQIDTYNQRRQAWSDVFLDWEKAGKPFDQQDLLIDWLEVAIRSATPSTNGPIPERPKFVNEQPPAPVAPSQPAETAKPPAAAGGGESPEKAKPEGEKPPASAAPSQPVEPAKPQEPAKSPVKATPSQPTESAKPQAAAGGSESPEKTMPEKAKQEVDKPSAKAASSQPVETVKPQEPAKPQTSEKPKIDSQKPSAEVVPKRPAEAAKPQTAAKSRPFRDVDKELAKKAPRRAVEPPLALPGPVATLPKPPVTAADLPLRWHEVDTKQTVDALVGPPVIPARREVAPRVIRGATVQLPPRPSMAIAVSLPRVVEPVLQPVAAVELPGQDHVKSLSFRPSAAEITPTAHSESREGTVEIEQEELVARIRGCNLAFRALEADLEEKGTWTAARLEPLVERLEILVLRRHDLELFRGVVPKEQRSSVESLASAKGVVSPVAAHIVEARTQASGSAFRGTEAERQRELGRLGELSRRLAALAEK
jgi:hypothetical protein